MRGLSKKMLISILTSVVVFVTMIATTFAWVGIFTYANTESFSLNLKALELDANYFLTISATGERGTFGDEADIVEIKRQIIANMSGMSIDSIDPKDSVNIEGLYKKYSKTTPSSCVIEDGQLSNFYSANNLVHDYYTTYNPTNPYIKFDLYLSVDTKEGIKFNEFGKVSEEIKINTNVFLTDLEDTIVGTLCKQKFTNLNPYKAMDDLPSKYSLLNELPDSAFFNINSANSVRFALCLYEPIDINSSYDDDSLPVKSLIYHGGTQNPSVNNGVYDLGGILPEEYNTALREYLIVRPNFIEVNHNNSVEKLRNDLSNAIERGNNDLDLIEDNSKIWTRPVDPNNEKYLGANDGVLTKQKVSVYLWFEGWDADCIVGINEQPVTLNLTFTAGVTD